MDRIMGLVLAIIVSFLHTGQNTAVKKAAIENVRPIVVTWALAAFSLVTLLPLYFAINVFYGSAQLDTMFWVALAIKLPLSLAATFLYVLAHKYGDMSLVNPLLSITPIIVLLIAPFVVHQEASLGGMLGVGLIVVGAYALNFDSRKAGFFEPVKMLFRNKGASCMMATATIWGITTVIDAIGVQSAKGNGLQSGISWAFFNNLSTILVLTPFVAKEAIAAFGEPSKLKKIAPAGLFSGAMDACQMVAMTMLLAAYVNAIKRFSMVLSVIVGAVFFKEKGIKERLVGSLIMLAGVVMIVLTK